MAFTYDPTTDRGKVRLLIHDTDADTAANQFFDDAEIDAFLEMNSEIVLLAAAQALLSMAADQNMTLKAIRVLDLQTDGPATARELRQQAAALRSQYEFNQNELITDYDGLFDWAEMVVDPFTARERVAAQAIDEVT